MWGSCCSVDLTEGALPPPSGGLSACSGVGPGRAWPRGASGGDIWANKKGAAVRRLTDVGTDFAFEPMAKALECDSLGGEVGGDGGFEFAGFLGVEPVARAGDFGEAGIESARE